MNFRALTLIVLMATWIVPANGFACPPDTADVAAHEHLAGLSSHSHESEKHSHLRTRQESQGYNHNHHHAGSATRSANLVALEELSTCCENMGAKSAVNAAIKNAEPRPKSSHASVLPPVVAAVRPTTRLTSTTTRWRGQQPPPGPYEKNRRPLLI